jgi:hypothetical protein
MCCAAKTTRQPFIPPLGRAKNDNDMYTCGHIFAGETRSPRPDKDQDSCTAFYESGEWSAKTDGSPEIRGLTVCDEALLNTSSPTIT